MKLCSVTALGAEQWVYRVYEIIHSAASGTSKNSRSSQGSLRLIADTRMRRSSSRSGAARPDSHFEIVPCDTRAMSAISACVMRKTHLRICDSGFGMRETYAKVNYSSRHHNADVHHHRRYAGKMHDDVPEIVSELLRITDLSQTALAKLVGVSQPTIQKWMAGIIQPSKPSWDKLMMFAASREDTAHLARQYFLSLFGDNPSFLAGLFTDAIRRKAS